MIRKTLFTLLLFVYSCTLFAQEVEIKTKAIEDNKIQIIVLNKTKFDQSVELDCTLDGMTASATLPKVKFIKASSAAIYVTLSPIDIYQAYSFGTSIRYVQGDVTAVHNDDFTYYLPYPKGQAYNLDQGYNGDRTHHNQNALDFNMNEGSEIAAIRGGLVTKVVEDNNKGCPNESCNSFNNYILITHNDGSIADYSHLKKNGAKVKTGQKVKAGEVIALSGSTGWASGPHLHLEVYLMTWDGQETIPVKYYLDKEEVGIPEERKRYTQRY